MFSIEKYDTVFQMTSTVCGRLQDDIQLIDMMRALFPCGSITGAPKINTMQYIASVGGHAKIHLLWNNWLITSKPKDDI